MLATPLHQLVIRTASLYGRRNRQFYLSLPIGHPKHSFENCWATFCSIHGLKDAPKKWNKKLHKILKDFGLKVSLVEPCLYTNGNLYVLIYVDDMIYFGLKENEEKEFEDYLRKEFNLKTTDNVTKFVGYELES